MQQEKRLQANKEKIVSLLKDINLKTKHIDKIVQKLKGLAERVEKAEAEILESQNRVRGEAPCPSISSNGFCA